MLVPRVGFIKCQYLFLSSTKSGARGFPSIIKAIFKHCLKSGGLAGAFDIAKGQSKQTRSVASKGAILFATLCGHTKRPKSMREPLQNTAFGAKIDVISRNNIPARLPRMHAEGHQCARVVKQGRGRKIQKCEYFSICLSG